MLTSPLKKSWHGGDVELNDVKQTLGTWRMQFNHNKLQDQRTVDDEWYEETVPQRTVDDECYERTLPCNPIQCWADSRTKELCPATQHNVEPWNDNTQRLPQRLPQHCIGEGGEECSSNMLPLQVFFHSPWRYADYVLAKNVPATCYHVKFSTLHPTN